MSNAPETEHDFGQDSTCRYCGASTDTESMVCEVRAKAEAEREKHAERAE